MINSPNGPVQDNRPLEARPDVLTYTTPPLDHDLTITGAVSADLFASTSGTDSDFIVKLIDVYPEGAQKDAWNPDDGPKPGEYAQCKRYTRRAGYRQGNRKSR